MGILGQYPQSLVLNITAVLMNADDSIRSSSHRDRSCKGFRFWKFVSRRIGSNMPETPMLYANKLIRASFKITAKAFWKLVIHIDHA